MVTGLLIGGQFSKNDRFHSFTYSLAQATVINEGLVQGLKFAVGRTRPDESDNHSFPSGHAATSFMIATTLQRYYGWPAGIIGYSAATFIAVSRARSDKHWASDLAAGATLGYIVGSSVGRRTGISIRTGKVALVPLVDLKHRSAGVRILRNRNREQRR
jgi:membrane-associated phospholipid phosphatase